MMNKKLEMELERQLREAGIEYVPQYRAIEGRKYAWDFFIPAANLLVEVQGGTWAWRRTAHTYGTGYRRDCEKNYLALMADYKPIAVTADMIRDGTALRIVKSFLEKENKNV